MFLLSPEKLLLVLAVAFVVLGPEKLPRVAKQIGGLWRTVRLWSERVEQEARATISGPSSPANHHAGNSVAPRVFGASGR